MRPTPDSRYIRCLNLVAAYGFLRDGFSLNLRDQAKALVVQGLTIREAAWIKVGKVRRCNGLQSSAARPDFIARIRPTLSETGAVVEPEFSETQPA
jgi:hypothetical protein